MRLSFKILCYYANTLKLYCKFFSSRVINVDYRIIRNTENYGQIWHQEYLHIFYGKPLFL